MLEIVSRIYDAAAGQDEWSDVVDGIRAHVNADILFLGAGNPRAPETLESWGAGYDQAPHEIAGYEPQDTWDPTINPAIPAGMIMPTERSFDHRQIIPEQTSLSSDFIRQTVYELQYEQHRLFVPMRDASILSGGFIGKGKNQAFDTKELERIDYLLPHLGRAMRLRHQLALHKSVEAELSSLLDRMHHAVFLVDRDLKVLFHNGLAEDLVLGDSGISIRRGRLALSRETPALRRALADIDRDALLAGNPPVIPVNVPDGSRPCVARVYPGTGFAGMSGANRVFASVIIERQGKWSLPETQTLESMYGLTPAEAAVARLIPVAGSRRAIAESLGLSENTIKSHLASIRAKTGARHQIELVQMLQETGG